MESLHFLNCIFASLASEKSVDPGEVDFFFFNISPLRSLNLILIPEAKLDDHNSTWRGCFNFDQKSFYE